MIKCFEKGSPERKALWGVAKFLEGLCKDGSVFVVDDIYFDSGQDWKWSSIVVWRKGNRDDSFQLLCPRDHALIVENICPSRMMDAVNNIVKDIKKYGLIEV